MNLSSLMEINSSPFVLCVIPNILAVPFSLFFIIFSIVYYYKHVKAYKKMRDHSQSKYGFEYQFSELARKTIDQYHSIDFKESNKDGNMVKNKENTKETTKDLNSLGDNLINSEESFNNANKLNESIELNEFIQSTHDNDNTLYLDETNESKNIHNLEKKNRIEKIRNANQKLLGYNNVIPSQLKEFILSILEENEMIIWTDCPSYQVRKYRTLKISLIFHICSILLNFTFGLIGAFIVQHPIDAISTSVMGLFSSYLFFMVGVYYTLSLTAPTILYVISNNRIIMCRRRGFFREKLRHEIISYDELPGILQITKYSYNKGNVLGDIHIQRNIQVINMESSKFWKLDDKSKSAFKGFKCVFHVDILEQLIQALIELKKHGYDIDPSLSFE